ncbi:hypothetical protein M011DRAFT_449765 [Sporormia fimetaria CBS 119925]|uniref:Maintenance of telomere capping protein 6 n=1 Tax=Sporormia fimetaria CBS 119925 TaxID=1340428 RepID=A0A6A6V4Y4_9PLEO|nr:hypothetical protein M011DRAFT_449765 [Sporormia fimetaria CBS 119925]
MHRRQYDPNLGDRLDPYDTWRTAFLSQRDVSLNIPINYRVGPVISLTAACFSHRRYHHTAFERCFSNLLDAGLKRFVVDAYWDSRRSMWGLCPVEVPVGDDVGTRFRRTIRGSSLDRVTHFNGATKDDLASQGSQDGRNDTYGPEPKVSTRQGETIQRTSILLRLSPALISYCLNAFEYTPHVVHSIPDDMLSSFSDYFTSTTDGNPVQLGSYSCSPTLTFKVLVDVLNGYIDSTDTTTAASILSLILDIHAAASAGAPDEPAIRTPLSADDHSISDELKGSLDDKLYTPSILNDDRRNLNDSWYNTDPSNLPAQGYYQVSKGDDDILFTEDGWPTEAFMEFSEYHRLVIGFGTIDEQMAHYRLSRDLDTIFAPNEIFRLRNTTSSENGTFTNGCLFNPSNTTLESINTTSWAITPLPALDLPPSPNNTNTTTPISNTLTCGLSPFLTCPFLETADEDPTPYLTLSSTQLWTWAPNEPSNTSHCAVLSLSPPHLGRWHTSPCTIPRYLSCQHSLNPFAWTLSRTRQTYISTRTTSTCPPSYTFSVPHTPLENSVLLSASLANPFAVDDGDVYLNINALSTRNCWTTAGANATCPYEPRDDENRARIVVVPTVATVVVFVCAVAFGFVKLAANRREGRKGRRRGGRSWGYEGVPA